MKVDEEFDLEGITYVVKRESHIDPCLGCAGNFDESLCDKFPDCAESCVIFVKKTEDKITKENRIQFLKQIIKLTEHSLKEYKKELKTLEDGDLNIGQ